jgi:phage terminase large subunit
LSTTTVDLNLPAAYQPLFEPYRYKVFYGGRGKAASWSFARALLVIVAKTGKRVLCTREYQSSIADSVHRLLTDQITALKLDHIYSPRLSEIRCINGGLFLFEGLRHNPTKIKSTEGIDIAWVAEAEKTSKDSWDILIPTIRKEGSEIWVEFNPDAEDDPTYQRMVVNPPEDSVVRYLTYRDNPFFPEVLRKEMEYDRRVDPDRYQWVWEGKTRTISDALVLHGKYVVEPFEHEDVDRYYYGADWGFSEDPTTLVRCYIIGRTLYVDQEAYGVGVDIDDTPQLFDSVPGSREWPIVADSARPETISYMRRKGYKIRSAKKGAGSVQDGIQYLRNFERIVIHPRCRHTIAEAGSYSYKRDRITGEVLPVLEDSHNHCIDALRYSLETMRTAKQTYIGRA